VPPPDRSRDEHDDGRVYGGPQRVRGVRAEPGAEPVEDLGTLRRERTIYQRIQPGRDGAEDLTAAMNETRWKYSERPQKAPGLGAT
jgi:hypothetical protein